MQLRTCTGLQLDLLLLFKRFASAIGDAEQADAVAVQCLRTLSCFI